MKFARRVHADRLALRADQRGDLLGGVAEAAADVEHPLSRLRAERSSADVARAHRGR